MACVVGRWLSRALPVAGRVMCPRTRAPLSGVKRWYSDELEFREPAGDQRYSKTHEWATLNGKVATIGISHYAQEKLGDIVFIELPEIDQVLEKSDTMGVLESVKAAADVHVPLSGTVVEVNTELEETPDHVNQDPYTKGWLIKLQVTDSGESEFNNLLDVSQYKAFLEESV